MFERMFTFFNSAKRCIQQNKNKKKIQYEIVRSAGTFSKI